jgi:hypothetical protein
MNQIYFVLQQALRPSAKKLAEGFTVTKSPGSSINTSYVMAILAVMLFSCFGAYAQTTYYSKAAATDFNDVNSWGTATDGTGTAPAAISNADNFIIRNNAVMTMSANATVRQLTITTGSLSVTTHSLMVGIASQKNSVLTINGGTLSVNSGTVMIDGYLNFSSGTFNQSGGDIIIDPNNGGATGSTTSTQYTLDLRAAVNWTGGTITLVDPPASTSTSHYSIHYNAGTSSEVGTGHIIRFGNGTSADAAGSTAGFLVYNFVGSGKLNFGNWEVYGPSAGNRKVRQQTYTNGIKGNLTLYTGAELDQNSVGMIIGGNIVANTGSTWTSNATITLALASGTSSVINPGAQTLSGDGLIRNLTTSPTANFTSITINNNGGFTSNRPLSLSGTLTLTSGIIQTSNVNTLTVGTATAQGTVSGGNATSYINGPLIRTVANNNTATSFINFPVGKSTYAPILLAPVTTSAISLKAEAFDGNAGTLASNISSLSTAVRWEAPVLSGTYTSIKVRIPNSSLIADNIPVMGTAAAGEYSAAFGNSSVFTAGTPNTIESLNGVTSANYTGFIGFGIGPLCTLPTPGATISSVTTPICLGTSIVLSVANATPGAGVTYQWQSSADGTNFTNIDGATASTLSTVPPSALYYRLKVTCSAGPSSAESTPFQVTFTNASPLTSGAGRCGQGTVILSATSADPAATIQWYDVLSGGVPLAGTTQFTTPVLTETKIYYAAASVITPGSAALGTGTTTTSTNGITPFTSNYEGSRTQYLIRADELAALGLVAGNITSLSFDVTVADPYVQKGYTVKMMHTTATSLTSFATGTPTTVYGPVNRAATVGANTFAFATPFVWDGTSNVIVEICTDNETTTPASCANCFGAANSTVRYTATSFTSVYGRYADNAIVCSSTTAGSSNNNTNRPNMVLVGQIGCSSARVPVTATIASPPALTLSTSAISVCEGSSTTVVTLTAGANDFDTYVWTPGTGVTGNAVTGWVFNPSATQTYTLLATQTAGNQCAATAAITVTVNPLPTNLVISNSGATSTCIGTVQSLTTSGALVPVQTTVGTDTTLNASNTSNAAYPAPYGAYYENTRQQYLILASELTALGLSAGSIISDLTFDVTTLNGSGVHKAYTISMGTTAQTAIATWETGLSTVFGPVDYQPVSGANKHVFTTEFTWNGTSNIIVQVCHTNDSTSSGTFFTANALSKYTTTTFNSSLVLRTDNTAACAATTITYTQAKRPNMVFGAKRPESVVWSPAANLYTDAAATTAYIAGSNTSMVYVKPAAAGAVLYTATAGTTCPVTATITISAVDCAIGWGNLQWPPSATINTCGTETVYGKVWKENITEAAGAHPNMKAWVGISTTNTDPATWTEAQWNAAQYNVQVDNDDEYKYTISGLAAGTYYYSFRYQYLTGSYWYGGYNIGGGGAWNGTSNVNGMLTVNAVALPTASDQTVCTGATVANLSASGTGLKWYSVSINGTALAGTDVITAGTYYVSQTIDGCESARVAVAVTLSTADVPVASVTQPTCTVATGTITVTSLGTGYTYSINGTDFQTGLEFTNIASGTYTLTAKNSIGCTATASVTVNAQPLPAATPAVAVTQPTCTVATGTLTVSSPTGADVQYSLNGGTYQSSAIFAGLTPGNYTITAQVNGGCVSAGETVTVNAQPLPATTPAAAVTQPTCTVATGTITVTSPTGADIQYSLNGGTYQASAIFAGLTPGDYTITAQVNGGCISAGETVTVNAQPVAPVVAPRPDVIICGGYTLPALTVGSYFTAPNAGGTMLMAGDVITTNQIIYMYAESAGCSDEESFTVTVNQIPNLGTVSDVTACGNYILPVRTAGNYYTGAAGTGTMLPAGTVISANQTIYVYAESATSPNCTAEESFDVTITTAPDQPTGASTQTITVADPADATIEDLQATAAVGTLSWYASEADAFSGTNPLAPGTQLVNNTTYYASAASGTCYSPTALAVTVTVALGRDDFSFTNLKYYPNPVTDKLTITHSSAIASVEVYNLLGQLVISQRPGTATADVNMSQLQEATYIVRISAEGKYKDFKIVKK